MKEKIILLVPLMLSACALSPKVDVNQYSDGIFEVVYTSKEGEHRKTVEGKHELLAAYAAQARSCKYFSRYRGVKGDTRSSLKSGMWATRRVKAELFQCNPDKKIGYKSVSQIIEIQESRYGSLRTLSNN